MGLDPTLLSHLVHDLRSPLTKVLSFAGFLETDLEALPPAAAEDLEHLVASAREAHELVTALGDWAHADRVRIADAVSLEECARAACDALAAEIDERSARVTVAALPTVRGDAAKLERLLRELIVNGLRHTGEGPTVRVSTVVAATGAALAVDDLGPGVSSEDRERFLAPLVRRGRSGGHGLGLAIAARIATAHGGRLWLDSAPEGGLRACLHL